MGRGIGDIARASLALGTNHGRAFGDAAQCLAKVGGTADERDCELPLVDVVGVVGRGQHLGFVYIVDAQTLKNLRLHKVPNTGFSHHRNRYRIDDALDEVRVAHASDAALRANVCRHALQSHHGHCTSVFSNLRLIRVDHVHDDAALEHFGHAALDEIGTDLGRAHVCSSFTGCGEKLASSLIASM